MKHRRLHQVIAGTIAVLFFIIYVQSANHPVLALTNAQTTTLAGRATIGVDTLKYATVKITLVGSSRFFTGTDLVPSVSVFVTADNTGAWSRKIIGTDSLSCGKCGVSATYDITIEHPILDRSGQKIEYRGLSIPANGSTTQLLSIISGM